MAAPGETADGAHVIRVFCLLIVIGSMSCSANPSPREDVGPAGAIPDDAAAAPDTLASNGGVSRFDIPPDHLPPPGQCRIWMPGEPPDEQAAAHPVGRCSTLRTTIPADAWLVYRPTDGGKYVRVWQFGEDREVLLQRIYDATTGELVRHVAPVGS